MIDGDTLEVDGKVIQLYGIDAPELGQLCKNDDSQSPCGVDAALALRKLVTVSDRELHCSPWGGEPPERTADDALIEVCQVGDKDLSEVMLQNGYGVTTPDSFPGYAEAEKGAKDARLGLWHSHFRLPWVLARRQGRPRRPAPRTATATSRVRSAPTAAGSTTCRPIPTTSRSRSTPAGASACSAATRTPGSPAGSA